ncbi:autophagy protein 16 [Dichotomopilus funicola]|uniref:Autophagy protein 16 n=1 Tax=Dichotomopilus funicola TaxID=1934379 RepID=A0AAN6V8S9_9PEZI|nr:autophagy protein 16 [Dichotomopilus funicola]
MADWRQEFVTGIRDAEKQFPYDRELVAAYSQLVDRVSVLEAEKASAQAQQQPSGTSTPNPASAAKSSPAPASPAPQAPGAPPTDDGPLVARLRLELAEALRAKGQSQQRLQTAEDELARLRSKATADTKTLRDLTAERRTLVVKLRDRDEELRVKNRLVADVQDELAVLNMQLDMVEKRRAEKEAENKQLVERFMKRVGQEAEAMNLANDPLFSKKR